jgi:hypothetical protein
MAMKESSKAMKGVSQRYDALIQLFGTMAAYIKRLNVRLEPPVRITPASRKIAVKILIEILQILVLAKSIISEKPGFLDRLKKKSGKGAHILFCRSLLMIVYSQCITLRSSWETRMYRTLFVDSID